MSDLTTGNLVAATIREKVQAAFIDLIPEEKWDEMIKKEVDWFTTDTMTATHYTGSKEVPSPLRSLIRQSLEDLAKEKIKEDLFSLNYWNENSLDIKNLAKEIAPVAMEAMCAKLVKNVIQSLQEGTHESYL
jgi:hypothetical protein